MSDAPQTTPKSMVARQLTPMDKGAAGFLKWVRVSMPAVYRDILPQVRALNAQAKMQSGGMGSLGDSGTSFLQPVGVDASALSVSDITIPAGDASASSGWADSVSKLISAWGQYKLTDMQLDTVKKITAMNLSRAQQGLAPLPYDASQLGLAPTVNVGLSGATSRLVMYGGLAFLGLIALRMLKPRRA